MTPALILENEDLNPWADLMYYPGKEAQVAEVRATLRKLEALGVPVMTAALTGSCFLTSGEYHDLDVVVKVPYIRVAEGAAAGFMQCCAAEEYEASCSTWSSWRDGDVNVIFEGDTARYHGWVASARVVRALNLTDRDQRVAVHRTILDGASA